MSRLAVTKRIIATKVAKGLKWSEIAKQVRLANTLLKELEGLLF